MRHSIYSAWQQSFSLCQSKFPIKNFLVHPKGYYLYIPGGDAKALLLKFIANLTILTSLEDSFLFFFFKFDLLESFTGLDKLGEKNFFLFY